MNDYIVRGTAADGQIRAFAATTKGIVEKAREAHNTSPVITAGLGRLLTAGAMMGTMMKDEGDILTIKVEGDGPVKSMLVTADSQGRVKGYAANPQVLIPANAKGKLDVAGAVGKGFLTVIKDIGLRDPYSGTVDLVSGEIAEDLTYYFASSEQTPSSVGLGVLMSKDNTVRQAGGFIVQAMPGASDETIDKLEKNISEISSVTSMLEEGMTPETMLNKILDGLDPVINDQIETSFYCNCSRERVTKALISVGKKELRAMVNEGKEIEVNCHFCNTNYTFSPEELKKLINRAVK